MIHDSVEQSEQTTSNLKLGCYGWNHASWAGRYYPDDLPEDWRLSYYANDFSCVLVPAEYCAQDDVSDWLDEVHEAFQFFIEWPQAAELQQQVIAACKKLQPQLGGIVVTELLPALHLKQYVLGANADAERIIWTAGIAKSSNFALIDSLQQMSLRQQREGLEQFYEASNQQAKTLIIKDVNIDHQQLNEMAVLIELLGY